MEMPEGTNLWCISLYEYMIFTCKTLCSLQVQWDEKPSADRPERVSPWKIELASTPTLDTHPVCRPKRSRVNMAPSSTDSFVSTREGMKQLADMLHNSLFFSFFHSNTVLVVR